MCDEPLCSRPQTSRLPPKVLSRLRNLSGDGACAAAARTGSLVAVAPLHITGHSAELRRDHYGPPVKCRGELSDGLAATARGFPNLAKADAFPSSAFARTYHAPLKALAKTRHQRALQEVADGRCRAVDKTWQRSERAEARAAKEGAAGRVAAVEELCFQLRLQCLVCEEEKLRLAVANEDMSYRLTLALTALGKGPAVAQAVLCRKGQSHTVTVSAVADPIPSPQAPATGARTQQARRAITAGGGLSALQAAVREATFSSVPFTSTLWASSPGGGDGDADTLFRPGTGHVRDSELLRALQAAERRVAVLEASLVPEAPEDSQPQQRELPDFHPMMPNIVVLTNGDEAAAQSPLHSVTSLPIE